MVGSSKILTVSYGTFSCTLEGFDEPFNTMKSIAEYFRDLAADDRYFGAEPPTPDAEMLHRIAEREIRDRVEARVGDNGVVLRQVTAAPAPAPAPAPAAPPASPGPARAARTAAPAAPAVQAEEVDPAADNVAAKLARIRAAVARTRAARDAAVYDEDLADTADTAPEMARAEPLAEAPAEAPAEPVSAADEPAQDADPAPIAPTDAPAPETFAQDDLSEDLDQLAEEEEAQAASGAPADGPAAPADPMPAQPEEESEAESAQPEPELGADAATVVEDEADEDVSGEVAEDADAAGEDMAERDLADEAPEAVADDETGLSAARDDRRPQTPAVEREALTAPAETDADATEADATDADATVDDTLLDELQTLALEDDAAAALDADAPGAGSADHTADAAPAPAETPAAGPLDEVAQDAAPAQPADTPPMAEPAAEHREAGDDDIFGEHLETLATDAPDADPAADLPSEEDAPIAGLSGADTDDDDDDEEEDIFAGLAEDDDDPVLEDDQREGEAAEAPEAAPETADAGQDIAADAAPEDDEEIEIEAEDTVDERGRPQARIIRLKRRDFEAALAAGDLEEVDEDEDEDVADAADGTPAAARGMDQIRSALGATSLDPAEEEALLQELAEVESEAATGAGTDEEFLPTVDDSEKNDSERALDRLLSKTNAKLGETEGSRRRSAIAHLKAAVAATKADRLLKGGKPDSERESAINKFRDDLAQVVRPRRPQDGAAGATARSEARSQRPAPLMLVSELRVDRPAASEHSGIAVRPRRISAEGGHEAAAAGTAPAVAADPVSFAEFARRAGATELPDLLEAAAAYATFVEGQDGLSRPQILRRAASVHADADMSREEGLRSFGHLLNSGRIRRLGRGRFAVADETRYATLARASGE